MVRKEDIKNRYKEKFNHKIDDKNTIESDSNDSIVSDNLESNELKEDIIVPTSNRIREISNNQNLKKTDKKKRMSKYNHSRPSIKRVKALSSDSISDGDKKEKVSKNKTLKKTKDSIVFKKNKKGANKKVVKGESKRNKNDKLIHNSTKCDNMYSTKRNVVKKFTHLSHKMDQFEERKDSDENAAIMGLDEGASLGQNRMRQSISKKYSRLKFSKPVEDNISKARTLRSKKFKGKITREHTSYAQKRGIKKAYSVNKRVASNNIKNRLKHIVKNVKVWAVNGLKKIGIYMIGPVFLFIVSGTMILSFVQSFSSGVNGIASTSYQSTDVEITNSHLIYTGLEADLKYAIKNVEDDYSEYNEYRYSLDSIGHNIHMLMAYLTSKYHDFTSSDVRGELSEIFRKQYDYRLTKVTETKYRTLYHSYTDPKTGTTYSWTSQEAYNWYVLKVSLETKDLKEILESNLTDDEKTLYDALLETKGNFTNLPSPFKEPWSNSISSYFGYRLDPILSDIRLHSGIDIAKAKATNLLSIIDGTVIKVNYDLNGLGHYIIVEDKKGQSVLYGHCSSIMASLGDEVVVGEVIALVGSSGKSTGPHVHLEIKDSAGNKLNPYFYLSQE